MEQFNPGHRPRGKPLFISSCAKLRKQEAQPPEETGAQKSNISGAGERLGAGKSGNSTGSAARNLGTRVTGDVWALHAGRQGHDPSRVPGHRGQGKSSASPGGQGLAVSTHTTLPRTDPGRATPSPWSSRLLGPQSGTATLREQKCKVSKQEGRGAPFPQSLLPEAGRAVGSGCTRAGGRCGRAGAMTPTGPAPVSNNFLLALPLSRAGRGR